MRKTTQLACRGMLEASFVMTTVKIHIYFPIITKRSFYLLLEAVGHLQCVINNCTNVSCSENQTNLRVRREGVTFPIAVPQDLLKYFASRSPQINKVIYAGIKDWRPSPPSVREAPLPLRYWVGFSVIARDLACLVTFQCFFIQYGPLAPAFRALLWEAGSCSTEYHPFEEDLNRASDFFSGGWGEGGGYETSTYLSNRLRKHFLLWGCISARHTFVLQGKS